MKLYPHDNNLRVRYKQLTFDCRTAVRDFECKQETKLIDSQNINNFYKHINRKLRNSSTCPVLTNQTGSCAYSDLDKAELFNSHFNSVNVDDDGNLPNFSRRAELNTKLDSVQFTAENVYRVTKRLKPNMTCDPGGYSSFLVKQLLSAFADPLALIFSSFYRLVKFHQHGRGLLLLPFLKRASHRIQLTTDLYR